MASKLSIDVQMNSAGYVRGATDAANSTKTLERTTEDYIKSCGSLRKELSASKKEAQNLAAAYSQLSKVEKQSEFGQNLKNQMDVAIEKAAELQDVMSDTAQAIKNSSSDTQTWDALKEGMEIGKSATLAYAGAVAKLTGNEAELTKLVKNLTMIENTFNTAIKIGNALQQQSAIMTSVRKVQLLAAARAEEMAATATGKATIAQKAFNLVAKSNPYVLLATAAIAAATAIGGYMLATSKASKEDERAAKAKQELHEASIEGTKDAQKEIVSLDLLYKTATDTNKSMEDRLDAVKQIRTEYPAYFGDLSNEAILTGEAADAYKELKNDIIAAAKARAYQNKIEKLAEEEIDLDDQIEKQKAVAEAARRRAEEMKKASMNSGTNGVAQVNLGSMGASSAASDAKAEEKALKDLQKQKEGNIAQQEKYRQEYDKTSASIKNLTNNEKEREKNKGRTGSGSGHSNIEKTKTELQKLQAEVTSWQQALENIDIEAPDASDVIKYVKDNLKQAQDQLKNYKIKVGLEAPKSELDNLKDELKQAEAELPFAISEEDVEAAQKKIKDLKDKIEKEEVRLKIKVDVEAEKLKADLQSISDIVKEALQKDISPKWNFDGLKDDAKDAANETVKQIERIEKAIEKLKKIKNPKLAEQTKEQIDTLETQKDALLESAEAFNKAAKEAREHQAQLELSKQSYDMMINSVSSIGSALKNLGAEEAGAAIQFVASSAQMIVQCIQNIAALQAQAIAAGTASGAALPFPANLAAIASIVATVIGIFASLPVFAEGGIVPGNSFTGDHMLIRANAGEGVMTTEQQKRLYDIANGLVEPATGNFGLVKVEGVLRGKDILLVQKNYNTIAKRSGQNIKIN